MPSPLVPCLPPSMSVFVDLGVVACSVTPTLTRTGPVPLQWQAGCGREVPTTCTPPHTPLHFMSTCPEPPPPPHTPLDDHQGGRTVLHEAVRAGHKEIVQLLIDKGASLDATDKVLRGGGCRLLVVFVLQRTVVLSPLYPVVGADPACQLPPPPFHSTYYVHQFGTTALHEAIRRGHKEIFQLLVNKGASPDVTECWVLRGGVGWRVSFACCFCCTAHIYTLTTIASPLSTTLKECFC